MTRHFRHISAYYQVMSNCKTVSLLQFYKFIIKCWQWCLKGNKLMRLNKLPWNEPEIFRIFYQIGTKVQNWMFLFSDGLSLIIRRFSLISNKNLFWCTKMLKLSKEGKQLQQSKCRCVTSYWKESQTNQEQCCSWSFTSLQLFTVFWQLKHFSAWEQKVFIENQRKPPNSER